MLFRSIVAWIGETASFSNLLARKGLEAAYRECHTAQLRLFTHNPVLPTRSRRRGQSHAATTWLALGE